MLVTRRWYYLIPAIGQPSKLVHRIEQSRLDALPGQKRVHPSWQEMEREIERMSGLLPPWPCNIPLATRSCLFRWSTLEPSSCSLHRKDHRQLRRSGKPLRGRAHSCADRQPFPGPTEDRRDSGSGPGKRSLSGCGLPMQQEQQGSASTISSSGCARRCGVRGLRAGNMAPMFPSTPIAPTPTG